MDYEKLHKDTISKLQEMVNSGKITVKIARGICADFIPESEDERIRKTIIVHFEGSHSSMYPYKGFTKKQILAWLEKQGEHANFRNNIQIGDKVTRNKDGVLVNLSQLKRIAKPAENKGKHGMGISEATKQKLEDNLNKALEKETSESWDKFLDEQGKQKSADKVESRQEELTEFEKAVKQVMEEAIECGDTHNLKADADLLLKLAQKSSWSEENDTFFKAIIRDIENIQYISEDAKKNRINWLKSLKDKYTWKPSDEQMDALYTYIYNPQYFNSPDPRMELVESVYKDLKKLKDEK